MAGRETYLAWLKQLQGPDVPKDVAEEIEQALHDPKATPYLLKGRCRSAAWKIIASYPRERVDWHPTVDGGKCTGCGKCLELCRDGVFSMEDGRVRVVRPEGCIVLCSHCMPECPAGAITFPPYANYMELLTALREKRP